VRRSLPITVLDSKFRSALSYSDGLNGQSNHGCLINLNKLNDARFVNKFLETCNSGLAPGGLFIGNIDPSHIRKKRVMDKYMSPLNQVVHIFDYVLNRVIPKLQFTRQTYFKVTRGENRIMSEIEFYGRLYSCGFELIDSREIQQKTWVIAKKVKTPAFDMNATYGPLIKLKRHGKGNVIMNVYKLRTMYPYSEYLQGYISSKHGLQKGGKFDSDPRITVVGRFLRRFWLDELPMIINVFRGDMKLFGIRPLSSQYLGLYPEHLRNLRANVKPGLIPPFYADLPETLDEITNSEEAYILSYMEKPFLTDFTYFVKAAYNILILRARSN
jgi:hypothetical protein